MSTYLQTLQIMVYVVNGGERCGTCTCDQAGNCMCVSMCVLCHSSHRPQVLPKSLTHLHTVLHAFALALHTLLNVFTGLHTHRTFTNV